MKLLSVIPFYETATTDSHGDIELREQLSNIIDITDEEADALDMLEGTGRMVQSDAEDFWSYYNKFLFNTVEVTNTGGVSITAGNEGTVTLSDATGVIVGDIIMAPITRAIGYIRAISGSDLTVYAVDAFAVAEDGIAVVPSGAIAEGDYAADDPAVGITRIKNQVQIFETAQTTSDRARAAKTTLKMPNGESAFVYKFENDVYKKHRIKINNAFWMGKYAEFAKTSGGTQNVILTRGLDSYVNDLGGVVRQSANTDSTVVKADFKTFTTALEAARSPRSGFLWCGSAVGNAIDDTFDTQLASGAVDYSTFGPMANAKQKAVELGVNAFNIYGFNFFKSKMRSLNHPNVTAATGSKFPNFAYYIPTTKVKSEDGTMVDRIRGRYLGIDGINSRWNVKYLGGLAPQPTEKDNNLRISVTSYEGLEVLAPQHMGRFEMRTA